MENKYSKTEFDGYTHRFVIRVETGEPYSSLINIYSNNDSYRDLEDFINKKKSSKVKSFRMEHRASKEQDELTAKLIEEMLPLI